MYFIATSLAFIFISLLYNATFGPDERRFSAFFRLCIFCTSLRAIFDEFQVLGYGLRRSVSWFLGLIARRAIPIVALKAILNAGTIISLIHLLLHICCLEQHRHVDCLLGWLYDLSQLGGQEVVRLIHICVSALAVGAALWSWSLSLLQSISV